MEATPSGMVTVVSPSQEENAFFPMEITPSGIAMDLSAPHLKNKPDSMDVMPAGKVIAVSFVQPLNAPAPMDVTPTGMAIVASELQPRNAPSPISFRFLGKVILVILHSAIFRQVFFFITMLLSDQGPRGLSRRLFFMSQKKHGVTSSPLSGSYIYPLLEGLGLFP
jgi:hypothetical protein